MTTRCIERVGTHAHRLCCLLIKYYTLIRPFLDKEMKQKWIALKKTHKTKVFMLKTEYDELHKL